MLAVGSPPLCWSPLKVAIPLPRFEGFGLGLRPLHYEAFLTTDVPVDFVEVISKNFMVDGGRPESSPYLLVPRNSIVVPRRALRW